MGVIVVQDPQTLKPYSIQIAGDSPTEDEQKEIQEFIQQQRQVVDQHLWSQLMISQALL